MDDVEDVGDVERCRAMSGDVEAMSRVSRMSRVSSDVEQPRHHDSQYASTSDYECAKLNLSFQFVLRQFRITMEY